MTRAVLAALALLLVLHRPAPAFAQQAPCRQPLARADIAAGSYGVVNARPFEGRVFVYVPAGSRQIWVVEGVYGRPFGRTSGPLAASEFAALRSNRNIRATPVTVGRADGSEGARVRVRKDTYVVAVVGAGAGGVRVVACGP
jgi:hypothetical protein